MQVSPAAGPCSRRGLAEGKPSWGALVGFTGVCLWVCSGSGRDQVFAIHLGEGWCTGVSGVPQIHVRPEPVNGTLVKLR